MKENETIGGLIEYEVRNSKMSIKAFAEQICCSRQNVYDIFRKNNINIDILGRISLVLNHNFFEDLAKDNKLAEIPEKVKTIKIKDLRNWLVDFIFNTIKTMHIDENDEFNEWVASFEKEEAEFVVDMEFIVDWQYDGVEEDEEVSEEAAAKYARDKIQEILDVWYIKPYQNFIRLGERHTKDFLSHFESFPKFPKNVPLDSLDFFHMALNELPEDELRNKKVKREVLVYLNEYPILFGEVYLTFDAELNIVEFVFDRSNSVL